MHEVWHNEHVVNQAAHTQFLNLGNKQDILHTDHNIGLIFHATGDFKSAKQKLMRSLEINEDLGNDIDKSDTTFHLISVLIDIGEFEIAKGYAIELNTL